MFRNIKELFFSKIPPPLVNFQAWAAEEEDTIHGSVISEVDKGLLLSKAKFDLEMGDSLGKDGVMHIPSILQNLDYVGIDEKMKSKDGGGDNRFDPSFFQPEQESEFPKNTLRAGRNASGDKKIPNAW